MRDKVCRSQLIKDERDTQFWVKCMDKLVQIVAISIRLVQIIANWNIITRHRIHV